MLDHYHLIDLLVEAGKEKEEKNKKADEIIELKKQIENGIKEKFNETSDILDDFVFDGNPDRYFLYAMLKKEFEFENEFDELDNGKFGEYDDVEYFGINSNSNELLRNQVQVLYYNSKEDFAIKLLTKQNDEVIIARGNEGNTFNEIYNDVKNKQANYQGSTELSEADKLRIPKINFDIKNINSETKISINVIIIFKFIII